MKSQARREEKKTASEKKKLVQLLLSIAMNSKDPRDDAAINAPPTNRLVMDDCPVCLEPLPWKSIERCYQQCCGKMLCNSCGTQMCKDKIAHQCPLCRCPMNYQQADDEVLSKMQDRLARGDTVAMFQM